MRSVQTLAKIRHDNQTHGQCRLSTEFNFILLRVKSNFRVGMNMKAIVAYQNVPNIFANMVFFPLCCRKYFALHEHIDIWYIQMVAQRT